MKEEKTKGLVYSTDAGRICPTCGYPIKQCCCSKENHRLQDDGVVRVSRQTKGRKGNGVCLITGVPLGEAELKELAKQLKQKCGSGGSIKNGVIEIQGDHRQILVDTLISLGYKAKVTGGVNLPDTLHRKLAPPKDLPSPAPLRPTRTLP